MAGRCMILGLALAVAGCAKEPPPERLEWPVMGTVAAVQTRGPGAPAARSALRPRFATLEGLLNAHDPESEICRLASLPDDAVLAACSPEVRPCYAAAFELMRASGGAFSPRWRGERTLDVGAIAKGFALDRASEALRGDMDVLVDLGGNLKSVRGDWTVGVKDPNGEGVSAVVTLHACEALATSAEYFRGKHIADGRTGRPVSNDVASVTVLSPSAMWADGLSTTLFILGPTEGERFLRTRLSAREPSAFGVAVLWILRNGRWVTADPERRFRRNRQGQPASLNENSSPGQDSLIP